MDEKQVVLALRFVRDSLAGLWGSALAPMLFQRMGLAYIPERQAKDQPAAE